MTDLKLNISNLKANLKTNHDNKELVKRYQVINNKLERVIDCRLYMGRSSNASVVYCDLWVRGDMGLHGSGNGQAGGYGYDKQQAAVIMAVTAAGVSFNNSQYVEVPELLLTLARVLDSAAKHAVF